MNQEKKNKAWVRVIDGGGSGFRRADVCGTEVKNFVAIDKEIDFDSLLNFVRKDINGQEICGVAYAIAGVIQGWNTVIKSPNAHFLDDVSLASQTTAIVRKPSFVCNDMDAAVTGMAELLPIEPYFMGITWSSGIGLRIWKNGEILSAAEGGHMVLDPSPFASLCGCGKRGHAEAIIGGQAIKRRVIAETEALGIKIPEGAHPCRFLDEEHAAGREWARNFYRMVGEGMGIFLANIQTTLYLPLIIWKGTFAIKTLIFLESIIRSKMQEVLIDPSLAYVEGLRFKITPGLENKDSLIGAAKMFKTFYGID